MKFQTNQQGMVLFFSLIVLLMMTIIGVALAVSSTQSLRMAGAGSERMEAMIAAKGSQDRVIASQSAAMVNIAVPIQTVDAELGVTNTLTPLVADDVPCQRTTKANSVAILCRRVEISSTSRFGRGNLGQLNIVAGVEQEVLP
jgi:type IV pilus assembly protein PilX